MNTKDNAAHDVPAEVMADAITKIAEGVQKLRASRLNDKAILLLISHASDIPQRDVKRVLETLESLETLYLKKKPTAR